MGFEPSTLSLVKLQLAVTSPALSGTNAIRVSHVVRHRARGAGEGPEIAPEGCMGLPADS